MNTTMLPRSTMCIWLAIALASSTAASQEVNTTSSYVPMADGIRLAVDVHLPAALAPHDRVPALLEITRYWRAAEHTETGAPLPSLSELDRFFLRHGYAVVKVDARGSGASFGTRPVEYGPQEVRDGYDVVEWAVSQPWSDGTVGAYGTSYSGTTAELLAAVEHPAVKALVPGWSDFDPYASPIRPYGLVAEFVEDWGRMVAAMDRNDASVLGARVKRVDADESGAMRDSAVAMHHGNPSVYESVMRAEYRDDVLADDITYGETGPIHWVDAIRRSNVPMLVLVSWLDAGTVEGTFQRLAGLPNPQKVVIMATSHGGRFHASPFAVEDEPVDPVPSVEEQFQLRLDFFDYYLRGVPNGVGAWAPLRYYNMGEERFREFDAWPPASAAGALETFHLCHDRSLCREAPSTPGSDQYEVDFGVTTGRNNRWRTQMGDPVFGLADRAAMDERMLSFTSPPLEETRDVLGTPVVALSLSSTHADGALLVYLEVVDSRGQSRYVTEGGIRLVHRAEVVDSQFGMPAAHTFGRGDAVPMTPGEVTVVRVRMWPTAVRLERGDRLRIAIAGADRGTFVRVPSEGQPVLSVEFGPGQPGSVTLPVLRTLAVP